ncbi:MAG TPA: hypothetical protein DCQ98_13015 [Planctomycetaceae bacterium]|nr:hypothetical protein [Planctomycetaceae bacterium]
MGRGQARSAADVVDPIDQAAGVVALGDLLRQHLVVVPIENAVQMSQQGAESQTHRNLGGDRESSGASRLRPIARMLGQSPG